MYLRYLEMEHIGKLEAYNNKIENLFRNTMPRYEKKILYDMDRIMEYSYA